jgi:hypothetical protein
MVANSTAETVSSSKPVHLYSLYGDIPFLDLLMVIGFNTSYMAPNSISIFQKNCYIHTCIQDRNTYSGNLCL